MKITTFDSDPESKKSDGNFIFSLVIVGLLREGYLTQEQAADISEKYYIDFSSRNSLWSRIRKKLFGTKDESGAWTYHFSKNITTISEEKPIEQTS